MDTTISMESLEKFEKNFDANRANAMAMNAVAANGVNASAKNYETERQRRRKRDCEYIFYQPGAGKNYQPEKERPLLDVRSIELPAFPGDQETES